MKNLHLRLILTHFSLVSFIFFISLGRSIKSWKLAFKKKKIEFKFLIKFRMLQILHSLNIFVLESYLCLVFKGWRSHPIGQFSCPSCYVVLAITVSNRDHGHLLTAHFHGVDAVVPNLIVLLGSFSRVSYP